MNRKVLSGILVAAVLAACSALGADVYRDAVFWFRGGKDANGDGLLNTSTSNKEFFNELKAADPNHASQTCIARGYADGIAIETEPVEGVQRVLRHIRNAVSLRLLFDVIEQIQIVVLRERRVRRNDQVL